MLADIAWRNPHILLEIATVGPDGNERVLSMEANSLYVFQRLGIERNDFEIGARIRIAARQSTRRETDFLATNLLLANDREFLLSAASTPRWNAATTIGRIQTREEDARRQVALDGNTGIFRVWSVPQPSGREWHVEPTQATLTARAEWNYLDNFSIRCEPEGMPRIMLNPHPFEFVDEGDRVLVRIELYDRLRIIHMDRTAPPQDEPASDLGYSVGAWDEDTLVVTTTNVSWPYFDNFGTPQGPEATIVERYSLADGGARLDYEFTVTDSDAFEEPAAVTGHMMALGEPIERYNCIPRGQ